MFSSFRWLSVWQQGAPVLKRTHHAEQLRNGVRSGLAVSILLVLKKYLKEAFGLAPERVMAFGPKSEARKQVRSFRLATAITKASLALHLNIR